MPEDLTNNVELDSSCPNDLRQITIAIQHADFLSKKDSVFVFGKDFCHSNKLKSLASKVAVNLKFKVSREGTFYLIINGIRFDFKPIDDLEDCLKGKDSVVVFTIE